MTELSDALRDHPIFRSRSDDDSWESVEAEADGPVARKTQLLAVRDDDMVVVVGDELRMASSDGGAATSSEPKDAQEGFATLRSPHLRFRIKQIVLSPNGRFLAVAGRKELAVIFLPRSDAIKKSSDVECRSFAIDEYTLSSRMPCEITQVRWHDLGEGSNALWVLTSDGKLREYDIFQPSDPAQTLTFLPSAVGTASKFSAIDPLSRYATSFAFGSSTSASPWSRFMVHVLIANGDVFVMGPVMPLRSEMPVRSVYLLKASADEKLRRAQDEVERQEGDHRLERALMQSKWADELVTQASYAIGDSAKGQAELLGEKIQLHPPHLSPSGGPASGAHRSVLRQGPIAFEPAPPEGDEEDVASDLISLHLSTSENASLANRSLGVLAIAWASGRIDLCLEVDDFEPRWVSSRDATIAGPSMPVAHSIQLAVPEDDFDFLATNGPLFVRDAGASSTVYVQHSCGADKIDLGSWVMSLLGPEVDGGVCEAVRVLQSKEDGQNPVYGLAAYSSGETRRLAAVTGDGRAASVLVGRLPAPAAVAPVETTFPAPAPLFSLQQPSVERTAKTLGPDKASLLLAQPVDFDKTISSARTQPDVASMLRKASAAGRPIDNVTGEHLRLIAEVAGKIQSQIQAIRAATQIIERRLDLQVQELQRQLQVMKDGRKYVKTFDRKYQVDKAESLLRKQEALGARMDKILKSLPNAYRPQISDIERRWFHELEGLKTRLYGGGGTFGLGRTRGMVSRIESLEDQLAAIRPSLRSLQREEVHTSGFIGPTASRQLRPLETALSAKAEEIRRLTRKFDSLSATLEQEQV